MKRLAMIIGLLALATTAHAGQAWYNSAKGVPYYWAKGTVSWVYDLGSLSTNCDNACGLKMINDAFAVWSSAGLLNSALGGTVTTANITSIQQGTTSEDMVVGNYLSYIMNTDMPPTFVFDYDGTIVTDLCSYQTPKCDPNIIMAWTILSDNDLDTATNTIKHGVTILNGPQYEKQGHDLFYSSVVHEIGHLLGLDHTGLGDDLVTANATSTYTIKTGMEQGIPTMYPIALTADQKTLHKDDVVIISTLYPKGDALSSQFCTITGNITDTKGKGIQGLEVQAQASNTDDAVIDAVSTMTGVNYPIPSNNGQFIIRGLVPQRKYVVWFAPLPTFSSGGSSIGNWSDPVTAVLVSQPTLTAPAIPDAATGICVANFPSCIITAASGAAKEISCDKPGMTIPMDTIQLSTATVDSQYASAPTPVAADVQTTTPAASGGSSGGCALIR